MLAKVAPVNTHVLPAENLMSIITKQKLQQMSNILTHLIKHSFTNTTSHLNTRVVFICPEVIKCLKRDGSNVSQMRSLKEISQITIEIRTWINNNTYTHYEM